MLSKIGTWLAWVLGGIAAFALAWMRGSRYKRKADKADDKARTASERADKAEKTTEIVRESHEIDEHFRRADTDELRHRMRAEAKDRG